MPAGGACDGIAGVCHGNRVLHHTKQREVVLGIAKGSDLVQAHPQVLCENLDAPVLAPACGDQVYEETPLDGKHEVEHGESLPQRGSQVPHVRLRHVAAEVCLDAAVPVETLDDADGVPIDSWVGRELLLRRAKVVGGPILLFLAR